MSAPKGSVPWNKGTSKGWLNQRGYIEVREDGKCHKQHRKVMERHLGRPLLSTEDVHHINGDKTDNRIENLEVLPHGKHTTVTNNNREYTRGKKVALSSEERLRRSLWMKSVHAKRRAALAKVQSAPPARNGARIDDEAADFLEGKEARR